MAWCALVFSYNDLSRYHFGRARGVDINMCGVRGVKLVSVLCYEAPVNQRLEKRGFFSDQTETKEYLVAATLSTRPAGTCASRNSVLYYTTSLMIVNQMWGIGSQKQPGSGLGKSEQSWICYLDLGMGGILTKGRGWRPVSKASPVQAADQVTTD